MQFRVADQRQVYSGNQLRRVIARGAFLDSCCDHLALVYPGPRENPVGPTGDTGFHRIRLDPQSVRTQELLREMEQEMGHLATIDAVTTARQDFHGPLFQERMKRYE
jgi:hypothetical protein